MGGLTRGAFPIHDRPQVSAMRLSDNDRITPPPQRRSPVAAIFVLLLATAGIGGIVYNYLNSADEGQRQQLQALKQVVQDVARQPEKPALAPTLAPAPEPAPAPPTVAPDPVAASEPAAEPEEEAPPLPLLDESDASIRQELATVSGWQSQVLPLLVGDQLLRRFVTFVNNTAAGKLDHKSGPFQPIKGRFAASNSMPLTMTPDSQARYNLYVNLVTALDPQQCAALYRRYYPLLNAAYGELGEKGNFHALVLKAITQLENTPDLTQSPALVPADKGLYKFASPQLEGLPAVQKQMLRSGWENVSQLKIWLRQLHAALLVKPA